MLCSKKRKFNLENWKKCKKSLIKKEKKLNVE